MFPVGGGDICVKSARPGANGTSIPSAFRSSLSLRSYFRVSLGNERSTFLTWKLAESACHTAGVSDEASDSTFVPAFGSSTVIVQAGVPYGRSAAWYGADA